MSFPRFLSCNNTEKYSDTGSNNHPYGVISRYTATAVARYCGVEMEEGSGGVYAGVAPQSEFIVVKLGNPMSGGFPRTTELMQGIDYVIRKAQELRMPVAVNISFGNTYGARDGTSLLERFINDISNIWKSCICIGTGNEGATAGHTSGRVSENVRANREQEIELAVQEKQPSLNVQIWKRYVDQIDISIVSAYRYTYRASQGAAWNTEIYCRCNRNTFVLRGAKSI